MKQCCLDSESLVLGEENEFKLVKHKNNLKQLQNQKKEIFPQGVP